MSLFRRKDPLAVLPGEPGEPTAPRRSLSLKRRLLGVTLATSLVVPSVIAAGIAGAQGTSQAQTWEVQAGDSDPAPGPGEPPPGTVFYEAQSFGPDPLLIRAGDTVKWNIMGLHTVSFWNLQRPLDVIVPGPEPGTLMLGPGFFPTVPTDQVVRFDSSKIISSGAPQGGPEGGPDQGPPTFSVQFPNPGTFGYVCAIHPGMRGTIDVLPAGAPLPETPAQAKTRGQVTLQALLGKVKSDTAQIQRISAAGTHVVWTGYSNPFESSALAFLPGEILVNRGDTVAFIMQDPHELHTVTFTGTQQSPEFIDVRPQPQGPPQFVIPANVAQPQGGNVFTGQGYYNSGLLETGAFAPGSRAAYVLKFDAPPGTYDYLCIVHPFMRGKVTVQG